MKVTRDVVVDLWPVYAAGEASADTRKLVEEYLRQDPALEKELRAAESTDLLPPAPAPLSPDHEMRTLRATRLALARHNWPLFLACLFSAMAFGRIVSDTSWDVSPKNFAVTAGIAGVFWIWFLVRLVRHLSRLR